LNVWFLDRLLALLDVDAGVRVLKRNLLDLLAEVRDL
jgi:hypothetical protein